MPSAHEPLAERENTISPPTRVQARHPRLARPAALFGGLLLVLTAGAAGAGSGCATSDQMLEPERELAEIQAKARVQAECKPGLEEPCYSGPEGSAGRGVCVEGMRSCNQDGLWEACSGESLPRRESCNRVDDDCDGIVDNGFEREGAICFRGEGACKSRGAWACSADGTKAECSAEIIPPSAEICDGVDNDCNGTVDDGAIAGTGDECSTAKAGVCNAGTRTCVAGSMRCVQKVQPSVEICNQLDDDCDNQVDEDCISPEDAAKLQAGG